MSIQDVIKKSFLEGFTGNTGKTGILTMTIILAVAFVFGLIICTIYNKFYIGVVYNRSFAITLVGMSVMTAMVTLAISTNIVISLGMVGALSIVRYRTAVKEPLDLLYLFWAITTGITVGAQMYYLAVAGAVSMAIVLIVLNRKKSGGNLYIAVVHFSGYEADNSIRHAMGSLKYRIKSKTVHGDNTELALEVYVSNNNMAFVEKLREVEGVTDVTAIQYDGEYHA